MDRIVVWVGFENVTDSFHTIGGVERLATATHQSDLGWLYQGCTQFDDDKTFVVR